MSINPQTIIQTAEIPPIPHVLQQILALADNPNTTTSQLEKLVSQEPALVTQMLKWVNSAYYALPRRVSSISHAMILLGFSTVKSIASGLMLINAFDAADLSDKVYVNSVWEHTLLAANFSKILSAKEPPQRQDDLFLAAMIHDVGHIVLREYFGKRYTLLLAKAQFPGPHDEDKLFGINHVVIGAALLKEWRFPESVNELVRFQHNLDGFPGPKKDIALLMVSDKLSREKNLRHFFLKEIHQVPSDFTEALHWTGWDWPMLLGAKDKFLQADEMTRKVFTESPKS